MPVMLTTTEQFDLWLEGETVEALKLQRSLPDGMLDIVARGEREDPPVEALAVRMMGRRVCRGLDRALAAKYVEPPRPRPRR